MTAPVTPNLNLNMNTSSDARANPIAYFSPVFDNVETNIDGNAYTTLIMGGVVIMLILFSMRGK